MLFLCSRLIVFLILVVTIFVFLPDDWFVLGVPNFLENRLLVVIFPELLQVESLRVVKQAVLNVAVALIAPERKVSEAEADHMVGVLATVLVQHVRVDVATALDSAAFRLQADPILATVTAVRAWVVHVDAFEGLLGRYVLLCAVRTVTLRCHCVHSFNV